MSKTKKQYYIILILVIVLILAVLFGFSRLRYVFSANYSEYKDFLSELPFFGEEELNIKNNDDYERIVSFKNQYPEVSVEYSVVLPQIGEVPDKIDKLRFDSLTVSEFSELSSLLEFLPNVKEIDLGAFGGENSFKSQDLLALKNEFPEISFSGKYEFRGKVFDLEDSTVDINHIRLDDNGDEILALAKCMPNLTFLDMDSCGIPNERMAEIRDALPNAKVVWRIWFGRDYTVRTDVETILASYSKPSTNILRDHNVQPLKYCRDVKNLDLGHNFITNISFISEMKDLEVCIIALNSWTDLSPIANCTKIRYLEIADTQLDSLEALRSLKNLKDLNAGNNRNLSDISPLFDLDLDSLWLGCNHKIPKAQIDEFQKTFPNCVINTTTWDSWDQGWRVNERFFPIVDIFQYLRRPIPYVLYWLDPLVQPEDMVDRENFLKEMAAVGEYPDMWKED